MVKYSVKDAISGTENAAPITEKCASQQKLISKCKHAPLPLLILIKKQK
jgi:hypothetical protein